MTSQHGALICIGGLPAAGKTTLSHSLRSRLGAETVLIDPDPIMVVVRDEIMADLPNKPPKGSPLTSEDLKIPGLRERAVVKMQDETRTALNEGRTVIVASAFVREKMRRDFEALAGKTHAFCPFWLEAPIEVLHERARNRIAESQKGASNSASTVGVDHIKLSLIEGDVQWPHINANRPLEAVFDDVCQGLPIRIRKGWHQRLEESNSNSSPGRVSP